MRLIDADKLHYIRVVFEDGWDSDVVVFAKEIDKAAKKFKGKAIPVEFIEKQIAKYNDWNEDVEPLLKLIEDWGKENESDSGLDTPKRYRKRIKTKPDIWW